MNDEYDEDPELCEAAADGDLEKCQALFEQWKQRRAPRPITALHLRPVIGEAIYYKHPKVVSYLIKQGAVICGLVIGGAIKPKDTTEDMILMIQTCLDHGWDINSKGNLRSPLLQYAIDNENLVRWLLDHGADPHLPGDKPGGTVLDNAAANATTTIIDLLISYGAKLADSDALHTAAGAGDRQGRVEMMAHLLDLGLDVNAMGRRHRPPGRRIGCGTPLHSAVLSNRTDYIEFLLQRGANMEIKNSLGMTPLEFAVDKNKTNAEAILRRAKEEAGTARGSTVLSTSDSVTLKNLRL